ncbi:MAG: nitrogen fixation protein FixH [Caldimonas sp.]
MTVASNPAAAARRSNPPSGAPWWRFGMVWFVLAGPAIVVVAGFTTMFIAYRGADVVLSEGPAEAVTRAPIGGPVSTTPALQARNHAATPAR